jgi:hypothetical protein
VDIATPPGGDSIGQAGPPVHEAVAADGSRATFTCAEVAAREPGQQRRMVVDEELPARRRRAAVGVGGVGVRAEEVGAVGVGHLGQRDDARRSGQGEEVNVEGGQVDRHPALPVGRHRHVAELGGEGPRPVDHPHPHVGVGLVVAAGGVMDGRGLAAALVLGAEAALAGPAAATPRTRRTGS